MDEAQHGEANEAQDQREYEVAAARLREQIPNILRRWEGYARRQIPIAQDLDREALYNNLHVVLEEIADVLAVGVNRDAFSYARIPAAQEHAHQRAGLERFSLDAIILEYHLLRRVVVEVMEEGTSLPRDVGRVLNDGIDRAMQEAAVYFVTENERTRASHEEARRLLTQQLLTAQETERHAISRELHDRSGQHLTALQLKLAALKPYCPPLTPASEIQGQLQAGLSELGQELHALSQQLRPLVLDDKGLCPALVSFLAECEERGGVPIEFQRLGVLNTVIPPEIETTLYRVAQEAVTNVLRHAQATHISVILEQQAGEARLVVEDNGCGFDAESRLAESKRLGVRGMRERAALVGGSLEVESALGVGTTLFLRVPLPDPLE